jgi:hypothetical protein
MWALNDTDRDPSASVAVREPDPEADVERVALKLTELVPAYTTTVEGRALK